MKTIITLSAAFVSLLCVGGGAEPVATPPAPAPLPVFEPQQWVCNDGVCQMVPLQRGRTVTRSVARVPRFSVWSQPVSPVASYNTLPIYSYQQPQVVQSNPIVQAPQMTERTYQVAKTEWVEEQREVTVMRPVKEMQTVKVPRTVYETRTEQVPMMTYQAVDCCQPMQQFAAPMAYQGDCCQPMQSFAYSDPGYMDAAYMGEDEFMTTQRTRTKRIGPLRRMFRRMRGL